MAVSGRSCKTRDQPTSDLVTVSLAARQLGLNKSSVCGQVRTLGFGRDEYGRFSLSASARAPDCRSASATPYPDMP